MCTTAHLLLRVGPQPGVVAHPFNPSNPEAGAGRTLSSRPVWFTQGIPTTDKVTQRNPFSKQRSQTVLTSWMRERDVGRRVPIGTATPTAVRIPAPQDYTDILKLASQLVQRTADLSFLLLKLSRTPLQTLLFQGTIPGTADPS